MDRFLTLTVFAKVVELGSFAGAADDLDLSPASVSGHVKALEARLKTRLLNRTTRRVAPTDEGAHYAVQDMIESGELVPVLDDWSWTGPPIGAIHLPSRFLSPKVQVFLECVRELLAGRVSAYRVDWEGR